MLLWIPAYFLGRAAHALAAGRGEELGARRWLTDPPLVVVALLILAAVLIGPLAPGTAAIVVENELYEQLLEPPVTEVREVTMTVALVAGALGVWWMLLAPFLAFTLHAVRAVLLPIGDGLRRRHAVLLGLVGLLLVVVSVALVLTV
jgi:hypothetical protein